MMKGILVTTGILLLSFSGPLSWASGGNLSLRSEIDFGQFTGRITACGFAADSPVNHVKPKAGNKFLRISVQIVKLKQPGEIRSASFVLDNGKAPIDKPGAWGKIEMMGSMSDFEASSGGTLVIHKAGETINLFFEVPGGAREQDYSLKYR